MVFSSNIFLFFFLPLFLAVYYLTPFKHKSFVILIGSFIFYCWWRVDFLALFFGITLINHLVALRIVANEGGIRARQWMIFGVVCNLLALALFKYFNFGVDTLNAALEGMGFRPMEFMHIVLPIGISFHAFQSISFLIDVYRKDAPPARSFMDFAAYNSLFPQMIAGPVLRYKDLADQFESRPHTLDQFSYGAYRFMLGFAKKVLIADTVAMLADSVYALPNPTMADAWIGALAYTVQLYFDFTGYSDMAIGIAAMMGFKFLENFDHPYISRSITEFWRRWHMSLSAWLKDYLYIPLGGNRKGKVRNYINLFLTMLLGGFWHGANFTFVIWGAWHGAWLAIEKAMGRKVDDAPMPVFKRIGLVLGTFFIVMLGWVMFRAPTVSKAFDIYEGMFGFNGFGISDAMAWQLPGMAVSALILGLGMVFVIPYYEARKGIKIREMSGFLPHMMAIVLFILAVMKLSYQSYSPFLYFQF
ncbi:MAG: MBOAT family protein [Alphaproteobacteria bacterium]|nr:MBOAT family protein [Alphaproteobacteria bacterium]